MRPRPRLRAASAQAVWPSHNRGRLINDRLRDVIFQPFVLRLKLFGIVPPRSYFVGAHVGARDLVGDAVDLGVGESLPQELELGAAGEAITDRDPQDRTVVLFYEVRAVGPPLEVGEVAILVQDPRQHGNLLVEGLVGQALAGRLHASLSAALEEADE